jgi:hypothetical protein
LEEKGVDGRLILKWMLIGWEVLVQVRVYTVDCGERVMKYPVPWNAKNLTSCLTTRLLEKTTLPWI